MNNMRNGFIGIYEVDGLDEQSSIHFNEWWNGEGMDFHIQSSKKDERVSLTLDELRAIAVIAHAVGMIELDGIEQEAKELLSDSIERRKSIVEMRDKYQAMYGEPR